MSDSMDGTNQQNIHNDKPCTNNTCTYWLPWKHQYKQATSNLVLTLMESVNNFFFALVSLLNLLTSGGIIRAWWQKMMMTRIGHDNTKALMITFWWAPPEHNSIFLHPVIHYETWNMSKDITVRGWGASMTGCGGLACYLLAVRSRSGLGSSASQ